MIVDAAGRPVQLAGFNLGGWFVLESFMSPMDRSRRLDDTWSVLDTLRRRFGEAHERALIATYQRNWIDDADIARIARAGYDLVRIPLWWGQFFALDDRTASGWRADGFAVLDPIVRACRRHGIRVVLDLHGAVGGQSPEGHTGHAGQNRYWTDPAAQASTDLLWRRIAAHFRGDPTIAGYDLLNEPAPPPTLPLQATVWTAYDRLYHVIRAVDPAHMIVMEATFGDWSWNTMPPPSRYGWTNVVYETHVYDWPRDGEPAQALAARVGAGTDRVIADIRAHDDWNVPGYVGEFNDFATGPRTWRRTIRAFEAAGLSWSMWSYKSVTGPAPNPWGYEDPFRWPRRPDPATDSPAAIARDWAGWRTDAAFRVNRAIGLDPAP